MTNLQLVAEDGAAISSQSSPWRSFGSIASALLAQAESRQREVLSDEDQRFSHMAWAAE